MRITIIGCGALGGLVSAHLIRNKFHIQVLQRKGAQLEALKNKGLIYIDDQEQPHHYKIPVISDDPADLTPADLVIVTVKAYQTAQLKTMGKLVQSEGIILSLQNGLGNIEALTSYLNQKQIAVGIGTYGAHKITPGTIKWGGDGQIILGALNKQTNIQWIQKLFQKADFTTKLVDDPEKYIWRKLAMNAMINPITALTGLKNGQLLEHAHIVILMKQIGKETVLAASRAGVFLDFDDIWATLKEGIKATAVNKSSMLQDISNGVQTEIEAISGKILQYAKDEIEFPYTRGVYALIKSIDIQKLK